MSIKGAPSMPHYVEAKAGVIGFTKSLALEVVEHNVLVNAIAPSALWLVSEPGGNLFVGQTLGPNSGDVMP